ncbi:MAG: hypothetical protein R3A51_17680 [Nannocystaceae bacterium]|nr:hypothetical protein [Myxococcales bacterium]
MNAKKIVLTLILVDFLAMTAWVMWEYGGPLAAMGALLSTTLGQLACFDLTIALSLAAVWIFKDARARGVSPTPYLALTLLTGSAGPLAYLIRRPERA